MIALIAQGMGIGFSAGMTPGPLQVFLLTQTLQNGWRHAIWIIFSPLLSDGPIVALILLALQSASGGLLRAVSLVGGGFILYLAWGLWKQIRAGDFAPPVDAAHVPTESTPAEAAAAVLAVPITPWGALRRAVAINALGPGPWLFWGTTMGPTVILAWQESPPSAIGFVVAFYGVFLGVMAIQVILFHQARRLGPGVMRTALWIGLAAMLFFAAGLFWRGLTGAV